MVELNFLHFKTDEASDGNRTSFNREILWQTTEEMMIHPAQEACTTTDSVDTHWTNIPATLFNLGSHYLLPLGFDS